jgi:hypothetical protein
VPQSSFVVPVAMLLSLCAAKIEEKSIKMKIENLLVAKRQI